MNWKALFATALLISAVTINPANAKTFKIATIAPDGTAWMNAIREGAEEITKRTDGRVKFRFYPGGIMGNDQSVMRKIRIGQLHGGALTGGSLSEISLGAQSYSVPFLFRSLDEVDYVRQKFDQQLMQAIEENGFVSFGFSEGGFAYLMSDSPVRSIEELSQKKAWIPDSDDLSRATLDAVGVAPTSLPITDVLTSLQTGLIDSVATSAMGAVALQWHTRVSHLTDLPVAYLTGTMVIDKKAFSKLKPEDQAITREVMEGVFAQLDAANRKSDAEARNALEHQGIEVVELSAEQRDAWRNQVDSAMQTMPNQPLLDTPLLKQINAYLNAYRNGSSAR